MRMTAHVIQKMLISHISQLVDGSTGNIYYFHLHSKNKILFSLSQQQYILFPL